MIPAIHEVTVNFNQKSVSDFSSFTRNFGGRMDDMRPVWQKTLPAIRADIARNFSNQGSIEGPWMPVTPKTQRAKNRRGQGSRTLVATGDMMRAATRSGAPGNVVKIDKKTLVWGVDMTMAGSNFNYAYVHDVTGVVRGDIASPVTREFMVLRPGRGGAVDTLRRAIREHVEDAVKAERRR